MRIIANRKVIIIMSKAKKSTTQKSVVVVEVATLCKAIALHVGLEKVDSLGKVMRGVLRKQHNCFAYDFLNNPKFTFHKKGQAPIFLEEEGTKKLVGLTTFHNDKAYEINEARASRFFLDTFIAMLPKKDIYDDIKSMSHTKLVKFVKENCRKDAMYSEII